MPDTPRFIENAYRARAAKKFQASSRPAEAAQAPVRRETIMLAASGSGVYGQLMVKHDRLRARHISGTRGT